jgi:hypothetical protein
LFTTGVIVVDRVVSNRPEAKLLARVPEALRDGCTQVPAPVEIGSSAALTCKDANGQEVRISLFDTRSGMDQVYGETIRGAGVARSSGDCAIASSAEHRYPGVGALAGRALCYRQDGSTVLVWTDDAEQIMARASRADGNDLELYRSWASLVGVPSYPTPDERALLSVVEQSSCRRAPPGTLDGLAGLVAAIECDPQTPDASKVSYYRFADLDGLRRSYNSHVSDTKAPRENCNGGSTPSFLGEGTQDLGSVVIGRALCHPQSGRRVCHRVDRRAAADPGPGCGHRPESAGRLARYTLRSTRRVDR